MGKIYFLKHAYPTLVAKTPPEKWELGIEGEVSAKIAAEHFLDQKVEYIFTSDEPKAKDTALIVASNLKMQINVVPGLGEINIAPREILSNDEHRNQNLSAFKSPKERVLGAESAEEALERFTTAMDKILAATNPSDNLLIVAHGMVISLYLGQGNFADSAEVWPKLDCLSCVEIDRLDFPVSKKIKSIVHLREKYRQ